MTRLRPTTLRGRVVLGAVAVVTIGLAVLVVAFNVLLASSLRADVDSSLRSRAAAALSTVSVEDGALVTSEGPGDAALDSGVWIYDGARAIERPRAAASLQRGVTALVRTSGVARDAPGARFRLYARPIRAQGRVRGTVVVASSLSAYDRTTNLALIGSLLFAAAVLAAMATVMWIAIGRALHPVDVMTTQAADWRDHDLDQRFGAGTRPQELQRLAATFDGLLDRVAASLRHEQRLSAELSHELRTPLARIAAQAEILARRPHTPEEQYAAAQLTRRSADRMTTILDTLMAAARAEASATHGLCDAVEAATGALEAVSPEAQRRGLETSVRGVPGTFAGVDREIAERVLGPLLDNAARFARGTISIEVARVGPDVQLDVRDDGRGIAEEQLQTIFEPGIRGDDVGHDGAGLGLPLARRLARAAGGDVQALTADGGGHLRLTLPAA